MTPYPFLRSFCLLMIAVLLSIRLTQMDHTESVGDQPRGEVRYAPFGLHFLLPVLLVMIAGLEWLSGGFTLSDLMELLGLNLQLLVFASVYFVLLLGLLPWLRKRISARACGFLWLAPSFLYVGYYSWSRLEYPRFILRLPEGWLFWLLPAWCLGSAIVLLASVLRHLSYRREILSAAEPVTDPDILALWKSEQLQAGRKPVCPLVVSPAVTTPLSIGLFKRSLRVVLPRTSYDREDLRLILRHEVVHLCRRDNWNKLFLTFCTALFWFNPLMWVARRRCGDDLELSCDETVLLNADQPLRNRYASLLLTTAGDGRGFTTCLSASAEGLRYRLKNVVQPTKRSLGGWALGVAFMLLSLPFGMAAVSWNHGTLGDLVLPPASELTQLSVSYTLKVDQPPTPLTPEDPQALLDLLSSLEVDQVAGLYDLDAREYPRLSIFWHQGEQVRCMILSDHRLTLTPDRFTDQQIYFLQAPPDWEALAACFGGPISH